MDKKSKAKAIRIEFLYPSRDTLRKLGDRLNGFCPFHEDTHKPNFYIFTKTNSWYCFAGCGGGDSISFYMRLKKIDFKEALNELWRKSQ